MLDRRALFGWIAAMPIAVREAIKNPPRVFQKFGGAGIVTLVQVREGALTQIVITNAGSGYTSGATVQVGGTQRLPAIFSAIPVSSLPRKSTMLP
jgi:hypothetical protein